MWAHWKRAAGDAADKQEAAEIDEVISCLPNVVKATLMQVYLQDGDMRDHVRCLGCPEGTIARRLGRADRLLIDQLGVKREERQREVERLRMQNDLRARRLR